VSATVGIDANTQENLQNLNTLKDQVVAFSNRGQGGFPEF